MSDRYEEIAVRILAEIHGVYPPEADEIDIGELAEALNSVIDERPLSHALRPGMFVVDMTALQRFH